MKKFLLPAIIAFFSISASAEERVIYTRPDGGVSVIVPIFGAMNPGETRTQFLDRLKAPLAARGIPTEVIDHTELPGREFRNAWERNGKSVSVNEAKARSDLEKQIVAAKRRKARDLIERETAGEDVTADRAALSGIDPAAIVSKAANLAALSKAWPSGLQRP